MSDEVIQISQVTGAAATVSANVRAECARRLMSQRDLAEALGWAPNTVSLRWNDRRAWQLRDLDDLARILKTTPWDLLKPQGAGVARSEGFEPPTF